jgi:phosphohistidine phosphatase
MKRLYLLRHAKSSWSEADLADFDRPLNERGLHTAPFMGRLIRARELVPDLIVSSPARRGRETAELVRENISADVEIQFNDTVYEASPHTLMHVVANFDERIKSAMLVGHNPGMEGLVRLLTGRNETMPTAALAVIGLNIDGWKTVAAGSGTLIEVIRPKEQANFDVPPGRNI